MVRVLFVRIGRHTAYPVVNGTSPATLGRTCEREVEKKLDPRLRTRLISVLARWSSLPRSEPSPPETRRVRWGVPSASPRDRRSKYSTAAIFRDRPSFPCNPPLHLLLLLLLPRLPFRRRRRTPRRRFYFLPPRTLSFSDCQPQEMNPFFCLPASVYRIFFFVPCCVSFSTHFFVPLSSFLA